MLNQLQGRLGRRYIALIAFIVVSLITWRTFDYTRQYNRWDSTSTSTSTQQNNKPPAERIKYIPSTYDWSKFKIFFPPESVKSPPAGQPKQLPKVQASQPPPAAGDSNHAVARREQIKAKFVKSWEAYKSFAWTKDELMPLSGKGKTSLSGWGAQLVDALDTLWIMDLKDDFYRAVKEVAVIDFAKMSDKSLNLFEVTIRYFGGLMAAYELSGEQALLDKAKELGDTLYMAFDTPNRLPNHYLRYDKAMEGTQFADTDMSGAAGGSLALEFTRLSQLTGDPKYYDATERVKEFLYRTQNQTLVPGLWPGSFNWKTETLIQTDKFTLGAGADSMYEYLPKMHALLGGLDPQYEEMTVAALDAARDYLLYRPMTPDDSDILLSGSSLERKGKQAMTADMEHLTCFAGGMYGLAGRLLARDDYVDLGGRLTAGCVWVYDAFETNIMPEASNYVPCEGLDGPCPFDAEKFPRRKPDSLPQGVLKVRDRRYMLRPEAIESVFYMWRITGDQVWRDAAWRMFEGIVKETETETAFATINDATARGSEKVDSMETFWLGETLKYFYLVFEDDNVISLDEWVFNTEAHPFKRPKA